MEWLILVLLLAAIIAGLWWFKRPRLRAFHLDVYPEGDPTTAVASKDFVLEPGESLVFAALADPTIPNAQLWMEVRSPGCWISNTGRSLQLVNREANGQLLRIPLIEEERVDIRLEGDHHAELVLRQVEDSEGREDAFRAREMPRDDDGASFDSETVPPESDNYNSREF